MIRYKTKVLLLLISTSVTLFSQNGFDVRTKLSSNNYETERTLEITLLSDKNIVCSFTKVLPPFYSVPQKAVFGNGNILLLHAQEGTFEIYDTDCNLVFKKENLINKLYNEHKIFFDVKNNKVALLVSENNKNKILIFGSDGTELNSFKIDDGIASGVVLSNNNKLIAVSYFNWNKDEIKNTTVTINLNTKKEKRFQLLFENGYFDKSANSFIGYTNKYFFEIDLTDDKIVFEKKITGNKLLLDVQKNNGGFYFIEAGLPVLQNGTWKYSSATVLQTGPNANTKVVEKINTPFTKIKFVKSGINHLRKNHKKYVLEIER